MDIANVTLVEDDASYVAFQITSAGVPLDIAILTVFAVIKATPEVDDSSPAAYTLTEGSGLTTTDAATGKIRIDVPTAVMASPGWWYYKIRVTASGRTETAISGWLAIQDA